VAQKEKAAAPANVKYRLYECIVITFSIDVILTSYNTHHIKYNLNRADLTRSVRQLQVQQREIDFLLPEAFNALFSRTDHHSTDRSVLHYRVAPKLVTL
jgi:hypothetical protein